jgi:hypothetical protein
MWVDRCHVSNEPVADIFTTTGMWICINYLDTNFCNAPQAGMSRVRFPMVSLEFLVDIILPAALWNWGRLSLQQK